VFNVTTAKTVLQSGYYVAKLLLVLPVYASVYLRWRLWRAKHAFKAELIRSGMPRNVVNMLTTHYNAQNKRIVSSLMGFRSIRGKAAQD
jgi:hypothetical protein